MDDVNQQWEEDVDWWMEEDDVNQSSEEDVDRPIEEDDTPRTKLKAFLGQPN